VVRATSDPREVVFAPDKDFWYWIRMKFIARWAFRLSVLTLVVAVALVLLKDLIARELIESAISQAIGLECHVPRLEMRLLSPTIVARDLRVYHPASLGGVRLVEVSEAFVEYDPSAILRRDLQLRLVRLHVAELALVEDKGGVSSLDVFKRVWSSLSSGDVGGWMRFAGVETLNLTVDRVSWLRLDRSKPPEHIDLRLRNQVFQNLRSSADFQAAFERALTPIIMNLATNRAVGTRPSAPGPPPPDPRRRVP